MIRMIGKLDFGESEFKWNQSMTRSLISSNQVPCLDTTKEQNEMKLTSKSCCIGKLRSLLQIRRTEDSSVKYFREIETRAHLKQFKLN